MCALIMVRMSLSALHSTPSCLVNIRPPSETMTYFALRRRFFRTTSAKSIIPLSSTPHACKRSRSGSARWHAALISVQVLSTVNAILRWAMLGVFSFVLAASPGISGEDFFAVSSKRFVSSCPTGYLSGCCPCVRFTLYAHHTEDFNGALLMPQAFGWIEVDGWRSKTRFAIPRSESRIEQVNPTGPSR